jgi:HK97 family phage prohead protease
MLMLALKGNYAGEQRLTGVPIDVKAVAENGLFEGYASVFGEKDLGGDIVEKGAFTKSLAQRGPRGVKMLADHDSTKRIGVWLDLAEDDHGLRVKGQITTEKQIGQEAYIDLKNGSLDTMSIGYRTISDQQDGRQRARLLKQVDLWEISLVTFPMLPSARVDAVKGDMPTEREFEEWLMGKRDAAWRFSASQAKAIVASGFKSIRSARDATGEKTDVADAYARLKTILQT